MTELELRVFIRRITIKDLQELQRLIFKSKKFHSPRIFLSTTEEECIKYINRSQNCNFEGLLVCHSNTNKLVGVVNLSQIFYGEFQNAYLSYYVDVDFAGQGLMLEGVGLAIDYAFQTLGLHRLEANIQPENKKSINLIERLGFCQEGFSKKYLKINGEWKDHERWALIAENWS